MMEMLGSRITQRTLMAALALATQTGCGSAEGGDGSLRILLEPEDSIVDGLEAGDGVEDIADGWTVEFERYVVLIADVDLALSRDQDVHAGAAEGFASDLAAIPAQGLEMTTLAGLAEGRWDFRYAVRGPDALTRLDASVDEADLARLSEGDHGYLVEGALRNPTGQSCPPAALAQPGDAEPNGSMSGGNPCYAAPEVRFDFAAGAHVIHGPCSVDGTPGVAVTAGATQTAAITIHGDHLFFNGFPEGAEGGVTRLAQWLADCDLDLDGTVTESELQSIAPSQLPELDARYQLGGAPIKPLSTMHDYVTAQLMTQGHFQGEGECPISIPR